MEGVQRGAVNPRTPSVVSILRPLGARAWAWGRCTRNHMVRVTVILWLGQLTTAWCRQQGCSQQCWLC
jgi:hypothetical protein